MTTAAALIAVLVGGLPATDRSPELTRLLRAHAPKVLETYRVPTAADYRGDWAVYARNKHTCPYMLSLDLNEDGRDEHVFLLPRRSGEGHGLFVLVSEAKGYSLQVVEEAARGQAWARGVVSGIEGGKVVRIGGESPVEYSWDGGTLRKTPPLIL